MTNKQIQEWKKDLIELHSVKAENERLRKFIKYVASIDGAVVSDPDNENPLSMGELQVGAEQALKG